MAGLGAGGRAPTVRRDPSTRRWTPSTDPPPGDARHAGALRACEVANWIEENLQVATKGRRTQALELNPVQAILLDYVASCWAAGLAVRCLVPKSRQQGVSTFWQALAFAMCVLHDAKGRAFRAVTVAHIEESANMIFGMSRRFERRLPKAWARKLESKQRGLIEWPSGSSVWVLSAQLGDSAGKGYTLDMVHGSEVANWADRGVNPGDLWSSVTNALAPTVASIVALESTAKGRDPFFHRMVDEALAHRSPYQVVFLPWFLTPEYRLSWADYRATRLALGWDLPVEFTPTLEEAELREHLAMTIVRPGEEWCRYRYELTDEQLIWRRHVTETQCDNKPEVFRRYYPSVLEDAFASTEQALFPATVLDRLWASAAPGRRCELSVGPDGAVRAAERDVGQLEVWADPVVGHDYVIGADVAEGLAAGDWSCAYVVDKVERAVVACWRGKIDPDEFEGQLALLGRLYSGPNGPAYLAVENNHCPSVATGLRKRDYPNLYWYRDPDVARARPARPGWNTNKRSRKTVLDVLSAVLRDGELRSSDRGFAEEAGWFVWQERRGVYAAPSGKHDDRVMALAIAVYVCNWRTDDGNKRRPKSKLEDDTPCEAYLCWEREQAEHKRRLARERRDNTKGLIL